MPGLRFSLLSVPQELYEGVLAAKHISDISTPGLIQRAFDLICVKEFGRNRLVIRREVYKERYYKMLNAVFVNTFPRI